MTMRAATDYQIQTTPMQGLFNKKPGLLLLAIQVSLVVQAQQAGRGLKQKNAIDAAERYKLWYNKPATNWNGALPVCNGFIGAMIFGNV